MAENKGQEIPAGWVYVKDEKQNIAISDNCLVFADYADCGTVASAIREFSEMRAEGYLDELCGWVNGDTVKWMNEAVARDMVDLGGGFDLAKIIEAGRQLQCAQDISDSLHDTMKYILLDNLEERGVVALSPESQETVEKAVLAAVWEPEETDIEKILDEVILNISSPEKCFLADDISENADGRSLADLQNNAMPAVKKEPPGPGADRDI